MKGFKRFKTLGFFIFLLLLLSISCTKKTKSKPIENRDTMTVSLKSDSTTRNIQTSDTIKKHASTTEDGKVIVLTTETFKKRVFDYEHNTEWNYLGDKPAIIDFYADWCGPCKRVAPIFDELAKEYAGKLYIYRLNVDENREVASVFGIRSIPSILFIPMNDKPQMAVGAYPKEFYVKAIHDILKIK